MPELKDTLNLFADKLVEKLNALKTELGQVTGFKGLSPDAGQSLTEDAEGKLYYKERTAAEIKTAYESNANTNAYPDSHKAQVEVLAASLEGKVDKVDGEGLTPAKFTQEEKDKLAAVEDAKWKGNYTTIENAKLEYPEGTGQTWHQDKGGWYLDVDSGSGADVVRYIWDATDLKWILQQGSTTAETAASVKTKYESNPDTNAFTDSHKTTVESLPAQSQPLITQKTAFNKDYGLIAGTTAEGNDQRILNGDEAFSWGDHSQAGYLVDPGYTPANDSEVVKLSGDQTINDVKTFSSSPKIPDAVNNDEPVSKGQLDTAIAGVGGGSTPPADYTDKADLLANQASQVEDQEYTMLNANGWNDPEQDAITHSNWATVKYLGTTNGDESDYDLREQFDVDAPGTGGGLILFNVEDYGAVHDGVTDDTVAIQNTINAAFSAGGGVVYFPKGIYIIGGTLQTNVGGINYNSQLYIPQSNLYDDDRPVIEFLGEVQPNLFQALGIGDYTAPNSGVVFRSTIQGSGVEPSVICNKGAATNFNGISYTSAQFKNIAIQLTPDANSKITMGGINCADSAIANFEYVTVYPYNQDLVLSGEPDVINVTGISMPKIATEHINTISKTTVGGFTNGYKVGEHTHAINAVAIACVNGFLITENNHTPVLYKIECNWCKYDISIDQATKVYSSSGYYLKVDNMLTEWKSQGVWYDSVATINDPLDRGRGFINFDTVEANVGLNNNKYNKIGGKNIQAKPMSLDISSEITASAYTLKYTDAFRKNKFNSSADQTITIPNNINWDNDQEITLRRQGTGRVILSGAAGVTISSPAGFNNEINAQYDAITLVKNSTNNYTAYGALKPTP